MLLDSDPRAAATQARALLNESPGNVAAGLLLAGAHRRLGEPAAAASALESLNSQLPVVRLELGRAYAASGRGTDATAAFEAAVRLDANLADGWRELAALRESAGDTRGGDVAFTRYVRLIGEPPALKDAVVAIAQNRLAAAESFLQQHLRTAPADVFALRMLADAASRREDLIGAEKQLFECLRIAPGYSDARFDLARLLHQQHRTREMLPLVERLLAAEPQNVEYVSLKAQALRLVSRNAEAVALMEQVVAEHPHEDRAWLLFGHLLREIGAKARAIECYRHALVVSRDCVRAYSSLASLQTYRFSAADIEAMRAQLARPAIQGVDRSSLELALGKALEDEAQYADSFAHYARAAALRRATFVYDADVVSANLRRAREVYSRQFFAARAGWGSERADPVFIVGMPRSGSTLIEQMLASHSQVEGTRELPEVPAIAAEITLRDAPDLNYPRSLATLSRAEVEAFANQFLERTRTYRSLGRARFIDKLPSNFGHIALIHLMFPNAAIIDARRHPLGCGFSCFKQLFARNVRYSSDLTELGRYYRDYAAFMDHLDAVLPGRVHRIYYEQLVTDPPGQLQRLLDYCRLPFEAECLRFYENRRIVQTISSEQVRQPIYAEGIDQWRHYEPWLGPLKEALGEVLENYPPAATPGPTAP